MKKVNILILSSVVLALATVGCSNDNNLPNCQRDAHALITAVDQNAHTVIVRQDLPMAINFLLDNSCGTLKNLEVVKNGFEWEVKAIAHYDGCDCIPTSETHTKPFVFRATETGVYTIKFLNPQGEAIVQTVTVTAN